MELAGQESAIGEIHQRVNVADTALAKQIGLFCEGASTVSGVIDAVGQPCWRACS